MEGCDTPFLRDQLAGPPHLGRDRGNDRQPVAPAGRGMTILPDAPWRNRAALGQLATVLGGGAGEARFVGGAVRDTLLGIDVADIDIATSHAPTEVIARLQDARIKAIPTGLAH